MDGGESDAPQGDQPNFDPKAKFGKKYEVFGHDQQAPDGDGLPDNWEQQGNVDGNEEGQLGGSDNAPVDGGIHSVGGLNKEQETVPYKPKPGQIKPKQPAVGTHFAKFEIEVRHAGDDKSKPKIPVIPILIGIIILLVTFISVMQFVINGGGVSKDATSEPTESTQNNTGNDSQPVSTESQPASEVTPTTVRQPSTTGGGGQQTGGGGTQPTAVVTVAPAECAAGWLPASGCTCCGTTLTCADGTVAEFNPQCGVGGGSKCTCDCPVGQPSCIDSCTGAVCVP